MLLYDPSKRLLLTWFRMPKHLFYYNNCYNSRTAMTRTLMARLPRLFRISNSFLSPLEKKSHSCRLRIISDDFLFYIENGILCVLIRIASLRRFLWEQTTYIHVKGHRKYTLISSNYPCLEHILMAPKVFKPLMFYCTWFKQYLFNRNSRVTEQYNKEHGTGFDGKPIAYIKVISCKMILIFIVEKENLLQQTWGWYKFMGHDGT